MDITTLAVLEFGPGRVRLDSKYPDEGVSLNLRNSLAYHGVTT
jgi:hypothetical protein